ncbi:MAG TPA: di-heme oxidoredictase family protein, partial [Labilithrix sp.]|nr:di-heme oxidoredictase family protein [Labilithrix sp.]
TGSEFRTMTLTRLAERSHFLHDGRALDLSSAITAHGGQGAAASTAFSSLSTADRDALLAFLGCL